MFHTENGHIWKQLIATAVSGWLTVAAGIAFGFSAVLLPELKKDDAFDIDQNVASWIASITPLSMVIGCLAAGTLIDRIGRKMGHIVLAVLSIISWITLGFAYNNTLMLIGRFIAGLSAGANRPVSLVYLGEITDPKYRGLILAGPSLTLNLGVLTTHTLGGFVYWKTSCFLYAGINLSCLLILLFLKESPLWLISRGETEKGVIAFEWFRGKGVDAANELKSVLQRQTEKSEFSYKDIFSMRFIKPMFTAILLSAVLQFNGVNTFTFYSQDLFEKTFEGSIDPFLLMVIMDIVRSGTLIFIVPCNRFLPRKQFFMFNNFACSFILFCLSAYLTYMDFSEYVWLSIIITVLYVTFGGASVMLSWSFVPELFSAHLRGLGSGLASAMSFFLLFIIIKIIPGFVDSYGQAATYVCYGVVTIALTIILIFTLPETHGRTLQDIEDSYKKKITAESPL